MSRSWVVATGRRDRRWAALALAWIVVAGEVAGGTGQPPTRLEREVRDALAGDENTAAVTAAVSGTEATLTGRVPTLWGKSRAIERVLDVDGIDTVVSELDIPAVEDDRALAAEIGAAIVNYPYYSMFDYVYGGVDAGVVTLAGSVTPERDKRGNIHERVAKIPGVQEIRSAIEVLPSLNGDATLRRVLAARISGNDVLHPYTRLRVPPFHVIVRGGTVTLQGLVRSRLEKRVLESVVRGTFGIVRVINELDTER